jgi:ankyrin repeat protein
MFIDYHEEYEDDDDEEYEDEVVERDEVPNYDYTNTDWNYWKRLILIRKIHPHTLFINCARHSNIEIVKKIINHPRVEAGILSNQVIKESAKRNDIPMVKLLLNNKSVQKNDPRFILCIASENGYIELLEYLIDIGFDPSCYNNFAITSKHKECVNLILKDNRVRRKIDNDRNIKIYNRYARLGLHTILSINALDIPFDLQIVIGSYVSHPYTDKEFYDLMKITEMKF